MSQGDRKRADREVDKQHKIDFVVAEVEDKIGEYLICSSLVVVVVAVAVVVVVVVDYLK
jgi:hypothetical protein